MVNVIILLVGIFAATFQCVRASPLSLDESDKPTPFRYTFRVETIEFGNGAFSDNNKHGTIQLDDSGEKVIYIDGDDVDHVLCDDDDDDEEEDQIARDEFKEHMENLEICTFENTELIVPDSGCVFIDEEKGSFHILNALSEDEFDIARGIFAEIGIEECKKSESGSYEEPTSRGCYVFNVDEGSIHVFAADTADTSNEEDIPPVIIDEDGDLLVIDEEGNIHAIGNDEDKEHQEGQGPEGENQQNNEIPTEDSYPGNNLQEAKGLLLKRSVALAKRANAAMKKEIASKRQSQDKKANGLKGKHQSQRKGRQHNQPRKGVHY